MMKRLFIGVLIILSTISAFTQEDPDSLFLVETFSCEDVAFDAANLIMYFDAIQDYDSASFILDNWQDVCGQSEPILRARILFAIHNNTFSEEMYDSTIIDHVLNYMMRMDTLSPSWLYNDYQDYFGNIPFRGEYDFFTQSIADELLQEVFYDPAELLFSEFYANVLTDPIKAIQKDTVYANTLLRGYYYQRVDKYRYKPDYHYSFFTGMWIPFDNAALLGNHFNFGFQFGLRSKKMIYSLSIDAKVGKSKNEYTFMKDGYSETTSTFLGIYFGVDIERELIAFGKNKISMLAGLGYDGFDAVKVNTEDDNPDNDKSHMISSLNTNFGLGYRHFFTKGEYIGLQGKYNIVNFSNPGGTNFSGNTLTISLIVGGFFNEKKSNALNQLRYIE